MEFEEELYAERLRRQAQQAGLSTGALQWAAELEPIVRTKLGDKIRSMSASEPMTASLPVESANADAAAAT